MLAVLSVALMVVDARFMILKPVRSQMSMVLMQSYWVVDLPQRLYQGVASQFGSRTELIAENEKLKTEALLLQGRLQKLAALTEQNVRLRELLNSSALVNEKVEVAELIGMDPNPFTHRIIINKGERDGVVLGQPVLDARGLMGQVVELMPYTSRVLLLTDTTHSIPVQVNRNGLRAIASGTGNPERLELRHVADTADIKEGDLLVSSGLGQRFPAGYPVATVKEVIHDSGQPFAIVRAVPTAALNRSRYLLLVFSDGRSPEERAADAAQAQESIDKGLEPSVMATLPPPTPAFPMWPQATVPTFPGSTTTHKPAAQPATPAPAATPAATPAARPAARPAASRPPASTPSNSNAREPIDG
ncbi:rod shape-determining protein MreC [Pseudomonas syringae]|uniref:Cell shape-determining protein MreC n=3 Tax=Pseudomonas syringae TaxID=317 RepID=A0AAN4QAF3_PSESF|nr:rod shape-determining protein MreC [Pseudomonas syringae]AKT32272.1 rod shape-determining protein MreC [Pseudomonas syringae pv. actinidiae ICMP 18884]AOE58615.1 rod shape-determining protein MreC [Pseudomonas syringae pv. actinidiae ICMP 18708]EPN79029.1 rod shape-determining protein MreC [Pseudomonas syringae pv. actinidiae ICMP 18801]APP99569.1 rod shape-determining protein MreC [Pseudomonas syringae pv. actinidiae]APQ05329.1 rod shape-determining protein MreC [Pseudomonas syringae pv. a